MLPDDGSVSSTQDAGAEPWQNAVAYVAARTSGPRLDPSVPITVHFHPDRLVDGVPLLEHLLTGGVYRSQFETGTSNGGLTARPGGDRWLWEQRIFGGAYDHAPADQRPKYGSLNHRRRAAGGSVRFGSAHLRLRPQGLARATFCYPDSAADPSRFGTAEHIALTELADTERLDLLDDYVEAHLHGSLVLARDVEAVVLDPAYLRTDNADIAARSPVAVEWHHGFRLAVAELGRQPEYRGEEVVELGERVAQGGVIDAAVIGRAVATGRHDPQRLKQLWHCTARFGYAWPGC